MSNCKETADSLRVPLTSLAKSCRLALQQLGLLCLLPILACLYTDYKDAYVNI